MGRLRQEDFDFLKADKPEINRHADKFSNGDEIVGTTETGEIIQGCISAIGDETYRIKSNTDGRNYTVPKFTARTVYQEKESIGD